MSGVSGVSGVSGMSGVSGVSGVSGCPGCLGCPGCPAPVTEPNGEVNSNGNCSNKSVRHYNWLTITLLFLRLCDGHGTGIGEPVAFAS